MDLGVSQFFTSLTTFAGTAGLMYSILRNFRHDMKNDIEKVRTEMKHDIEIVRSDMRNDMRELKAESIQKYNEIQLRIEKQENRIFQLTMGKSFKEILLEERALEEKLTEKMDAIYNE